MTRLATTHADASESPGLLLWRVTNDWQAAVRAALKPFELTHVQFVLLASLTWLAPTREHPTRTQGPVTQKELADHAATDPMMTSQVIRVLADRGLVRREPHPEDGRAMALEVTEEGIALANRAVVVVEECDRRFFAPVGDGPRFVADLRALTARRASH